MYHLVVTHPFDKYHRGDKITDAAEMAKWAVSHAHFVVRVAAPAEPEKPLPKPELPRFKPAAKVTPAN